MIPEQALSYLIKINYIVIESPNIEQAKVIDLEGEIHLRSRSDISEYVATKFPSQIYSTFDKAGLHQSETSSRTCKNNENVILALSKFFNYVFK